MRLVRDEFIPEFRKRGVPASVLYTQHPDQIERHIAHIEIPRDEKTTIIEKRRQVNAVNGFKKLSDKKPYFLLAAARNYDVMPCQLALSIAVGAVEDNKNFLWHVLTGSTSDALRDNENPQKILKDNRLLVISNLASNSTTMKIEKARDIIVTYSQTNRILCVAGDDPVAFSRNILHLKPDIFCYFTLFLTIGVMGWVKSFLLGLLESNIIA